MKKFLAISLMALVLAATGCTVVSPDPGQEAVLVSKPILFGSGGVQDETVKTGRSFAAFTTEAIYVDVTPQAIEVSFDDLSSKDNILLDFETNVQIQVTNASHLYKTKGPKWFENNIVAPYRSLVRDAVKSAEMSALMSDPVTAAAVDKDVTEKLSLLAKEQLGDDVIIRGVSLGRAKPNPDVLTQMNLTAAEQQRAKTMVQAKLAETQRKEQQIAKAEADDAYRLRMSLTPEQYLRLQIANVQADACKASEKCVIAPPGSSILVQ